MLTPYTDLRKCTRHTDGCWTGPLWAIITDAATAGQEATERKQSGPSVDQTLAGFFVQGFEVPPSPSGSRMNLRRLLPLILVSAISTATARSPLPLLGVGAAVRVMSWGVCTPSARQTSSGGVPEGRWEVLWLTWAGAPGQPGQLPAIKSHSV